MANLVRYRFTMLNTTDTPIPASEETPDPHGIDHERERRLTKVFVGLIAAGFLLVLVMLGIAITLDATLGNGFISTPAPVFDPSTVKRVDTTGTSP